MEQLEIKGERKGGGENTEQKRESLVHTLDLLGADTVTSMYSI